MNINAAICDDNAQDTRFVKNSLKTWAAARGITTRTQVFPSAESFLFQYADDKTWDILLLDIEMGRMDGVEMARTIRRENDFCEADLRIPGSDGGAGIAGRPGHPGTEPVGLL